MILKQIALGAAALLAAGSIAFAQSQPVPPAQPPAAQAPPAAQPGTVAPDAGGGGRGPGRNAMAACRADMQALCNDVPRGKGARVQCLVANQAKVSPDCASALKTVQDRLDGRGGRGKRAAGEEGRGHGPQRGRLAACRTDIATHCGAVAKGRGGRIACLTENQATLSPACGEALAQMPRAKKSGG